MLTPEEARRRDALMAEDKHLDKIILAYIPMITISLLFIVTFYVARYCHAHQANPPIFHVSRSRSHFLLMELIPISAVVLLLYPGIRFEEDRLTIHRWKIFPNKLPSALFFALSLWAFLKVHPRAIREADMIRLYRTLVIAATLIICIPARILIYVLYRYKMSPYFNKKSGPWWPDNYVLIAVTVLPLLAALLIDRHFDKIAFPYRY